MEKINLRTARKNHSDLNINVELCSEFLKILIECIHPNLLLFEVFEKGPKFGSFGPNLIEFRAQNVIHWLGNCVLIKSSTVM